MASRTAGGRRSARSGAGGMVKDCLFVDGCFKLGLRRISCRSRCSSPSILCATAASVSPGWRAASRAADCCPTGTGRRRACRSSSSHSSRDRQLVGSSSGSIASSSSCSIRSASARAAACAFATLACSATRRRCSSAARCLSASSRFLFSASSAFLAAARLCARATAASC